MSAKNSKDTKDDFFTPIGNTKPFFKAGLQGFAGTGKTYTAALIAIGLHNRIKSKKPVIIFDTEKAAKFLKPMFEAADIQVLLRESRSLADLKITMKKMSEGISDVLIIDSISHVWENFLESYKKKVKRTYLQFQDWGIIKPTWKETFSDPFVLGQYHVVMCGRAGYEYENEINDNGRREIFKSGVKMKVEGETAYEPDLLVLMERLQEMEGGHIKNVIRRANILKDRSSLIDGKLFENPTYENFEPTINTILEAPIESTATIEKDTATLFKTEEDKAAYKREITKVLENIEGLLTANYPGHSGKDKVTKLNALEDTFGTYSWTEIKEKSLKVLEDGYSRLLDWITSAQEGDIPI